jgi:23S rRNA pseudouridine1911/1915/1917 synthase
MKNRGQDIRIVYEDRWLIVIDKPAGLLTMSTGKTGEVTAYTMLTDYLGRVFIVHRLDRETSGLLVFAKDMETKTALQERWDEVVLKRRYHAVLEGDIEDEEGWIETWLYENPKSFKVSCYPLREGDYKEKPPREGWQYASSHCRTVRKGQIDGQSYTCVEFELETGRKNQIRVHARWIGAPVAGDKKYGAETDPFGRLALHAQELTFIHPWTRKTMNFMSPLPKSFRRVKESPVVK